MPARAYDQFNRLTRLDSIMGEEIDLPILILQDCCYLMHASLPACIKLPVVMCNNYDFNPQYMLLKLTGSNSEDAYILYLKFRICV